ncbi:MAG: hypothetical protein GOMPHAMPRED_007172 [Gomphillus americanus]|uniref:Uncharacterized protein n=1 Tax=Gomphillus americanus TaxID=1940652 RepID=A0A8H3IC80_9LECA|nr:MAG: hypothetical protein GOMPHAMPRED_007172 [Gomphillus americanus]
MSSPDSVEQYDIVWITALAMELAAATAFLDETYEEPNDFARNSSDDNVYGLASATRVVERMILSLPHVKIGLLVGIGAGISVNYPNIRLGGIAVSQPEGATGVGR